MAIRNDITINWEISPRLITVLAPSVNITMQDLYDTLRSMEDDIANMDDDFIVSGSGKESLGGGVLVGLTITLNNAQLAFEARGGPTFIQCNVTGGNLVATDMNDDIISSIYPTAYTQVILTSSSSATLQELEAIQYGSYNGGVWIDVSSNYTGILYPIGTPISPVNNLPDALNIANTYGFNTFNIIDNINIAYEPSGGWNELVWNGHGKH